MSPVPVDDVTLNWATIAAGSPVEGWGDIHWDGLVRYAVENKAQRTKSQEQTECHPSREYSKGGRNLVRRLHFRDGTCWVARIQLGRATPASAERLTHEAHTMMCLRDRSGLPVPEVYAYETTCENPAKVPFILMEFIPGDTAMDSFGGYHVHQGQMPAEHKPKFYAAIADIQVQMSGIRFPQIGSITKLPDSTYSVGPIPGIGGPFDSASQFFQAWATRAKYPFSDDFVRERTPAQYVDGLLKAIRSFPDRLVQLAASYAFREGPFPLVHTDLYSSNIIVDRECNILSVIDWEDSFVGPWEMVEFAKTVSMVPPMMDGPAYVEDEHDRERLLERDDYVESARQAEKARHLDDSLSSILANTRVQHLAHALWLYEDGRIGFYDAVFDLFNADSG